MDYRLRIALRYLFTPKSHSAVNIISAVSVGGVAIAVAAIVCVLSVFNGFNMLVSDNTAHYSPDIVIAPRQGKTIVSADSIACIVAGIDGVAAVSPVVEERALAITAGGSQTPVRIIGIADNFTSVSALSSTIIDGAFIVSTADDIPTAVMAVGPAISLNIHPGSETPLKLIVPRREGRINPANPTAAFRTDTMAVAGVFQTNEADFDSDIIIIPIDRARQLLSHDSNAATMLYISTNQGKSEAEVSRAITAALPESLSVKDRAAMQEPSFRMIAIEKWITFAMMAFILLVASFNIISTLTMLIVEKASNFNILKALGVPERSIAGIFNRVGWLISFAGVIAGLILGSLLCMLQQHFGLVHLNGDSDMLVTDIYPVDLQPLDLLAIAAISIVIALMTTTFTSPFTRRYLLYR